ncbi:MAG: DUF748 domain-containing protein [Deltaproteobacteria bacterium]|jgi:hypothetical protein|nr:DUF748 domain-containing protein [Deltaproteobacteria bacterium]
MKKLITFILFLIVLLVILLVVGLIYINPILEQQKPQLESFLSEKLNNEVTIGKIEFNLYPNPAIKINDVELKSKSKKSLKLGYFVLDMSLLQIFSKKITINSLLVVDLNLELTRTASGKILANGLDFEKELAGEQAAKAPETAAGNSKKFDIQVTKINFRDINLTLIDQTVKPELKIPLSITKIDLGNIVLEPFESDFNVVLSLLGTKKNNFTFSGGAKFQTGDPLKSDLDLNLELANFDIAKLKAVVKAYSGVDLNVIPLDNNAAVKLVFKYPGVATGVNLNLNLVLQSNPTSKANALLKYVKDRFNLVLDLIFKGTAFKLDLNFNTDLKNNLDIFPSQLNLFNGQVNFQATYGLMNKNLNFNAKALGLDVAQICKFVAPEQKDLSFSGTIQNSEINLKGNTGKLSKTITGNLNTVVKNGAVEGINMLTKSLETSLKVPGLTSALAEYLPEKYKSLLKNERTVFETMQLVTTLREQKIQVTKFLLTHPDYEISGSGEVTFAGKLALKALLRLNKETSDHIIKKNVKLKFLLDTEERIAIPVLISKSAVGKPVVLPDVEELTQRATKGLIAEKAEVITEKLDKKLNKLFGGSKK